MMSDNKTESFSQRLLEWYSLNARGFPWRNAQEPFKVLIAEKLLQQTTYGHVLKVYEFFIEKYPDVYSLSRAKVEEIEGVIRRLGFQRQRSRQFNEMATKLINEFDGRVPSSKEDLMKLKGVGNYIANAVLCFAFNQDVPIIDMNVRRVVGRYFEWANANDKEIENKLHKLIPNGKGKEFNWAIIDFSSIICSRKPKCNRCFLSESCSYLYKN